MSQKDFQIAEIIRVISSMISYGRVREVSSEGDRAKVEIEDGLVTPFLHTLRKKAASDKESWPLELGEQVLCIFPYGKLANGIIMGSVFSNQTRPKDKNFHHMEYSDGTSFSYDKSTKKVALNVAEGGSLEVTIKNGTLTIRPENELKYESLNVTIEAKEKVTLKAENVTLDAKKVTLGGSVSTGKIVTTESICAFTGTPHPDGSSKCFAAK